MKIDIVEIQKGNVEEIAKFLVSNKSVLEGIAIKFGLTDRELIEDLVQETIIKILQNPEAFDSLLQDKDLAKSEKKAIWMVWVERVFRNRLVHSMEKRRLKKIPYYLTEGSSNSMDLEESVRDPKTNIEVKDVMELIEKDSGVYNELLKLYFIEGKNIKEIAKKLQVSTGTANRQLTKAKNHLSQQINKHILNIDLNG